jgi:hypothetical protein
MDRISRLLRKSIGTARVEAVLAIVALAVAALLYWYMISSR